MDKDEMIKDIRAIIDDRCEAELGQVHAESKGGKVTKTVSTSLIAKDIYNANCRIIADDEIVIKKSEYEALKKDKNDYKQRLESSDKRYEQLVRTSVETLEKKHQYWETKCKEIGDVAGKETAREILQELKDKQIYILTNDLFGGNTALIQAINELAKAYGIELG